MPAAADQTEAQHLMKMLQKWGVVIQSVMPFMTDHFKNDITGYEFRDWFISRQTLAHYNAITADLSAQDLFNLIQSHPGLKNEFQPPDKLQVFLQEFSTPPGKEPEGTVVDEEKV